MLSKLENEAQGMELPRGKMVKKKRKILLSGLMVGPIKKEAWEPPDPKLLGYGKRYCPPSRHAHTSQSAS